VFLDSSQRVAGHVRDFIEALVGFVAAFKLRPATITHTLHIEGVSELQQPILELRQRPKIRGRRALEPLSSFQCR
jgi:hypothetical protein